MDPLPLSQRDPARFHLESVRTDLVKRVVRTYRRGMSGKIDKDQAPGYGVGLKAALAILDRTDPVPKAVVEANVLGDLVITWQTPEPSSSPTPLEPSKPNFTPLSLPNGHGLPSSSATDDLASL